ncbi:MAG: hypothetical protein IK125_02640, partial [Lachnospiraceae bacterium]|nr:hypothetical protein [Lachnospiraceae bacterium]
LFSGMLLFWLRSVFVRLLPTKARDYIVASAILMLAFIGLRTFKYRAVVDNVWVCRHVDYAYWVPELLIPTLFFMTAIRIRRGDKQGGTWREAYLLIPAVLLSIFALTNDLHKSIYIPEIPLSELMMKSGTYSYGIGFYLLLLWMCLSTFMGFVILLRVTRKRSVGVMVMVLVVLGVWIFLEMQLYLVLARNDLRRMYNSPEIRCFGMLAIFEACIRGRLIPHNENHVEFFEKLTLPVMITDWSLTPVYRSAIPVVADPAQLKEALTKPCYLDEDTRLSGMKLWTGYAFWTQDETQLHKENRRLTSANEILSEENDLIEVENKLKEKKAHLDAEARVYQRIADVIYPKQKQIEALLNGAGPESAEFPQALARCCVLNAWSKRKSNLILLSQDTIQKNNRELFLALQETARFLKGCGVEAAAVGEEYSELPLEVVHGLYDSFETVIETYLPCLKRMTVSLTPAGVRLAMEADTAPELPETPLPVKRTESDGLTYLTIFAETGGETA